MEYIVSEKIKKEKIGSDAIEKMLPWTVADGTFAALLEKLKPRDGKGAILDIGVGSGESLRLAEPYFEKMFGVDLVSYLAPDLAKRVRFAAVDLNFEKLPQENNSLQMVTAFQVIEHLENPFMVMRETARVLKSGGYFIFSVPNPYQLTFKIKFLFTGNMPPWTKENNHLLFLTKDVFRKTYLANFDLMETIYQRGSVPFWGRLRLIFGKIIGKHAMILPRSEVFGRRVCYVLRKK